MLLTGAVVGSTVEAAFYALVNELFFISTRKTPPVFYKKLTVPILGTEIDAEAWNKVNLMLGLMSKRIPTDELSTVRIADQSLKIIKDNVAFKYEFEKIYVFDSTGVEIDNDIKTAGEKTFIVFDDFELSTLGPKRYRLKPITEGPNFIREMHFYCSDRVPGSNFITDCVTESELTLDQLSSFEYSDSMARFAVERHLSSIGVHGRFMKLYSNGDAKYRKPKVTHVKRFVFEKDNNTYFDTDSVKFLSKSLEEIIEESTEG